MAATEAGDDDSAGEQSRVTVAQVAKSGQRDVVREVLEPGGLVPSRRVPWAMLIRRVFLDDVLRCPTCKGARRLIGEVADPAAIAAILEHLGVDEDAEGQVPVRGPPQARLPWPT